MSGNKSTHGWCLSIQFDKAVKSVSLNSALPESRCITLKNKTPKTPVTLTLDQKLNVIKDNDTGISSRKLVLQFADPDTTNL